VFHCELVKTKPSWISKGILGRRLSFKLHEQPGERENSLKMPVSNPLKEVKYQSQKAEGSSGISWSTFQRLRHKFSNIESTAVIR